MFNLSENACECCLDTFLDAHEISNDLLHKKCLNKFIENSEYFVDLTKLTKTGKKSLKST